MTSPKKPEWLEISESDERSAVKRASKRLRILTLSASLLVIGVGAVTAQASNPSSPDDGIINVALASPLSTDSDSTDSDSTDSDSDHDSDSTDSDSTDSDSDHDSDSDEDSDEDDE